MVLYCTPLTWIKTSVTQLEFVSVAKMSFNDQHDNNQTVERRLKVIRAVTPDVDYTLAIKRPQIIATFSGIHFQ